MADSRFFAVSGPFTLAQLAEISGAEIGGDGDPDMKFSDVSALETAAKTDVSFLDNKRYVDAFAQSGAGVCLVHPSLAEKAPKGMALLLSKDPYRAYAKVAQAFYPNAENLGDVSSHAVVDPTAQLGDGCVIEPGAVVGAGVSIGARCRIGANAVIGTGVEIGDDCVIGPCASLTHSVVGKRVIIHAGVRAGQDGFGFALGPQGHEKVPQLGRVIIGDDVEIGANTTIDRGAGPDTVIGAGTKIDNLVQIAHNVELGRGCIVVSQVGISGSTKVGDFAMMGGQAGLTGHLKIGTGAKIAAQSGVMRDVEPGATVAGSPALPAREHWRQIATLAGLSKKKGRGTE
ncbi:MAG: UDP-3-O-(3-hydroxymyristoyl)glucosamine N-acyltransferase [Rhodospirillales bacterium]|nr:UDP-3-O-(3-hydroxymyristoyl)glucosamine N-acyltransferase [Rhodospirillales bacterium]